PLMVSRGMPSLTFLHSTALEIQRADDEGKLTYIYQFGDWDPSGAIAIPRMIEGKLSKMCEELDCEPPVFERVALTAEHIAEYSLNREDAESFLSALDPAATFFTFQTFDDNAQRKNKNLARILHGTLGSRWELLANLNQRGAGIFITVNETDGEGRENGNVK